MTVTRLSVTAYPGPWYGPRFLSLARLIGGRAGGRSATSATSRPTDQTALCLHHCSRSIHSIYCLSMPLDFLDAYSLRELLSETQRSWACGSGACAKPGAPCNLTLAVCLLQPPPLVLLPVSATRRRDLPCCPLPFDPLFLPAARFVATRCDTRPQKADLCDNRHLG